MIELAMWSAGWRFEVLPCGCREEESPSHVGQRYCEEHAAIHRRSWILVSKDYLAMCREAERQPPPTPEGREGGEPKPKPDP